MAGIADLEYTRSLSRYGSGQVTVVFKDGTDIYFARQLVNERLQQAKEQLPTGIETAMGPISTGLGEIFMWTVEAKPGAQNAGRRAVQRRPICARFRTGSSSRSCAPCRVSSRSTRSAATRSSIHVAPDPARLVAYGSQLPRRDDGAGANNANVGAGYIERNGEQYLVRAPGQVADIEEIRDDRRRHAQRRADPHPRRRRRRDRQGAAHRRGDRERRGSRARHGHHADRREQPHRLAARRGEARARSAQSLPEGVDAPRRSTTAPTSSTPRSRPSRRTCSKARCWSSSSCSCCSATSAPR